MRIAGALASSSEETLAFVLVFTLLSPALARAADVPGLGGADEGSMASARLESPGASLSMPLAGAIDLSPEAASIPQAIMDSAGPVHAAAAAASDPIRAARSEGAPRSGGAGADAARGQRWPLEWKAGALLRHGEGAAESAASGDTDDVSADYAQGRREFDSAGSEQTAAVPVNMMPEPRVSALRLMDVRESGGVIYLSYFGFNGNDTILVACNHSNGKIWWSMNSRGNSHAFSARGLADFRKSLEAAKGAIKARIEGLETEIPKESDRDLIRHDYESELEMIEAAYAGASAGDSTSPSAVGEVNTMPEPRVSALRLMDVRESGGIIYLSYFGFNGTDTILVACNHNNGSIWWSVNSGGSSHAFSAKGLADFGKSLEAAKAALEARIRNLSTEISNESDRDLIRHDYESELEMIEAAYARASRRGTGA